MAKQSDFISITNEEYLSATGYSSVEEWAADSDYHYDSENNVWKDEDDEIVDIDEQLSFAIDDATWGWDIDSWANDCDYKRDSEGDWSEHVQESFKEAFFSDLLSTIKSEKYWKEHRNDMEKEKE